MEIKTYRFPPHGDERGQLVALEAMEDIPFQVKRVYYIYDTLPGVVRGKHAHRCLEQILVCVHGSCKVALEDGQERREILLDDPTLGLYISNDTWREMYDFSEGAVLLVLASEHYDEADYIRDYARFLDMVRGRREDGCP
ncbi:MAG: WxcM-like domain-containing protein [Oscillospiraceae bacterium]|nr:WxcM-like domain-containing protein [Oscillospiraceae bacterium]